jgi:type 2A phosphatase activator TIP41
MPHSWFVLARLFLRVDNVLFRIHDVRIYHAFGEDHVIREVLGMEASYEDIKSVSLSLVQLGQFTSGADAI